MAYYLQMDGVDDYIKTPALTFNKIVFDFIVNPVPNVTSIYADARTGIGFSYIQRNSANNDGWGTGSAKVNGVTVSNNTPFVPNNQRVTLEWSMSLGTDDVNIFSNNGGAAAFCRGAIYDVKFYNGTNLVAHYNMTLGNVQDQSGNGRHATLFGGTWVQDGPVEPVGSSVSISYSLAQRLFVTKTESSVTKQLAYKPVQMSPNLTQSIYASRTLTSALKHSVFANKSESSDLKQAISADKTTHYSSKQSVYKIASNQYDTLAELYSDYVIRTDDFAMKLDIYRSKTDDYSIVQRIYKEISALRADVKQAIFKSESSKVNSRQVIARIDSLEHALKQSLFKSAADRYATEQRLLEDFREYRQAIEYILEIRTKMDAEMTITRRIEHDIEI